MKITIHCVYDSTDAAEFAASRLRRTIKGIRVTGISKRFMSDKTQETTLFPFPLVGAAISTMDFTGYMPAGIYTGAIMGGSNDARNETSNREDVRLFVETEDPQAANSVVKIMRSTGGREIHQISK